LVKDYVLVIGESDDLGTQLAPLMRLNLYRKYFKNRHKKIFETIKSHGNFKIHFHSCGAVRQFLPDLIEAGIDILNPVQVSAAGMDTRELKKDFGNDLSFWGGGCDTQFILPNGNREDIRSEVKRRIDDLAPGGGFVFNPVHNIQVGVSPRNFMIMWEAWKEYGAY
jgi:uroporphyrinogen decarboxylase